MIVDLNLSITRSEGLVSTVIDNETVILSLAKGEYFGLDPVASHIWELIEIPTKVGNLVDSILEDFDVDRETCETDVLAFVHDMVDKKMVLLNS
jgi:hypothetical protein